MKNCCRVFFCLAVLACIPLGFAEAGFIEGTVKAELADVNGGPPSWAGPGFTFDCETGCLALDELYGGPEPLAHLISGQTDGDPIMNITKEINNDSEFTWYGFELTLPENENNTFTGAASSDVFTLISQDAYKIVFGTPETLEQGETMTLNFSVLIPSSGPFSFTLTQAPVPVPEPSMLVLLVLGVAGAMLCIRKK